MKIIHSIAFKTISCILAFSFLITGPSNATITDALKPPKSDSNEILQLGSDLSQAPQFSITDPEKIIIAENMGRVREIFKGNNGKLIINIQDAHCNFEAQTNISQILDLLVSHGLKIVALEGSTGEIDPSVFTTYPDEAIRNEVATYFLKKGKINGAEYLAITSKNPPQLYGVETKEYYLANLATFLNTLKERNKIKAACANIRDMLDKLKARIYSKELKALDERAITNRNDEIKLTDYCWFLKQMAESKKVPIGQFPNLTLLYKTTEIEKTIDFDKVAGERAALITIMEKTLGSKELEELFLKSVSFKSARINATQYHVYLRRLALVKNADYAKYPNLNLYTDYLLIYEKINTPNLFVELGGLERAIKERLFTNDEQRTLDKLSRNITLLENMIDISMSKEDVDYYQQNRNDFKSAAFTDFINSQAKRYKIKAECNLDFALVDKYLPDLENFYRIAEARDDAILENTLKKMEDEGAQVVALITGGYHTQGIAERLRDRGISYVVIAPRITKANKDNPYLEILSEEKVPETGSLKTVNTQLAVSSAMEKDGVNTRNEGDFADEVRRTLAAAEDRKYPNRPVPATYSHGGNPNLNIGTMLGDIRASTSPGVVSQLSPEQISDQYGDRGDCGVFAHVGPALREGGLEPHDTMFRGAKDLEYRGYQSSGCLVIGTKEDGTVVMSDKLAVLGGADALNNAIGSIPQEILNNSRVEIVHERWPTTSPATHANQHPIVVGNIAIIFNGDVTNFDRLDAWLAQEAERLGDPNLKRPEGVGTDAWTIAALIYRFYRYDTPHRPGEREDLLKAIRMAYEKMEGYFAVVVVSPNFPDAAFGFVKSDMPLYIGLGENKPGALIGNFFSSDPGAVVRWARYSQKIKDGDIAVITGESALVYRLQPDGKIRAISRVIPEDITRAMETRSLPTEGIPVEYKVTELNPAEYMYILEPGHDYYFEQEIWYQPQAIAATIWGYIPPPLYPEKALYTMSIGDLRETAQYRDRCYQILIDQKRLPTLQETDGKNPSVNQNRVSILNTWIQNPTEAEGKGVLFPGINVSLKEIREYRKLLFAASGTSGHAAEAQMGNLKKMTGMNVEVVSGTKYVDTVNSELRTLFRELKRNGVKLNEFMSQAEVDKHFPGEQFKGEAKAEDLAVLIKVLFKIERDKRYNRIPEMHIFRKLVREAKETLGIAVSQSGGTKDTLNIIIICQALGMKFMSIINKPGVTDIGIKTESDGGLVLTYAGTEKGVASTKAHTCQQALIGELGIYFGLVRGTLSQVSARNKLQSLLTRPKLIQYILEILDHRAETNWAKKVAVRLAGVQAILYLGRGGDDRMFVVAKEGALKMKEETYAMADAQNLGEMKHGPISFFPATRDIHIRKYAVIVLTDKDNIDSAFLNLREIIGRDGRPICIIYSKDEKRIKGFLIGKTEEEVQRNERQIADLQAHLTMMGQHNLSTEQFLRRVEAGTIELNNNGGTQEREQLLSLLRELVTRGDELSVHVDRIEEHNARLREMEENIFVIPSDPQDEAEDDWSPIVSIVPLQVLTLETVLEINGTSKIIAGLASKLYWLLREYAEYYRQNQHIKQIMDVKYEDVIRDIDRTWNVLAGRGKLGKVDEMKIKQVRAAIDDALNASSPSDRMTRADRLMVTLFSKEISRVAFFENALSEYYPNPDFPQWDKGQLNSAREIMKQTYTQAERETHTAEEARERFFELAYAKLESIISSLNERQEYVAKERRASRPVENTWLAQIYNAWNTEIGVAHYMETHPDKPRGLAKVVTVEDRIPVDIRRELRLLGFSGETINALGRAVMRAEGLQLKTNRSFIRLLAKMHRTNVGEVLRNSLFHERMHNMLMLLAGFDKEELNRRVTEALDKVERAQRRQHQPVFTQKFRKKFGSFMDQSEFIEEVIIKYYTAKFLRQGEELFEGIGPEIEHIAESIRIEYSDANLANLAKVSRLAVPDDPQAGTLFLAELRGRLPRNLTELFDIRFLNPINATEREAGSEVSDQIIKLGQITRIALAFGAIPRIEFEAQPSIEAEVGVAQGNLVKRRVPQRDIWTPQEKERMDGVRATLIANGVTIPTDFEELYIGPEVDVRKIGRGTYIHAGTVILGKQTFIGEDCTISGTVNNCSIGHDTDVINPTGKTIKDSTFGAFCVIENSSVANYYVGLNVRIENSTVFMEGKSFFGNGISIPIGPETGGRNVVVYADMDYETARQLAEHPIGGDLSQIKPENRDMHEKNNQLCQRYVASITAKGKGHVGRGTRIIGVSRLENSYVGEYARLENVGGVRNSTILSSREEPTILDGKATEIDTILIQKGVSISSGVIAKNSIVFEHSELTNGFTLTNSIVAPNCVLEQGEGTSFLFGPFYVSHHKGALNIGAMAPQGRVNVGAGAELVSNHPGTRPEQEANIGEGIFFGMDSTCGAPLDLSRSPYSLIGRGIHLISKQRIKFPFSLISEKSPTSQLGMGHNLIEPGTINPFFVAYNEWKYKNRNKARRHTFDLEVFRPEIIDMIIDAKNRLEHLKGSPFMREVMERDQKRTITIYTNKEIDGLGKCFMTEDGRRQGIKTYTDIITRYALRGLKREVESLFRREITSWEAVRENLATDSNPRWVHERTILERELGINIGTLTMDTVFARLNELASLENGWHEAVCQVREREWAEGGQIIDDYADAHKSPLQDSFLNEVMKPELEKFLGEIIAIRIKMVYVNPALGIMASGSAKERDVTSNI